MVLYQLLTCGCISTSVFISYHPGYVKGERSVIGDNDSVESSWKGYAISNEAILDPNSAWLEAQNLISNQLDPGLSKSQVLFWVSTREGFSPGTTVEVSPMIDVGESDEQNEGVVTKKPSSQVKPSNAGSHLASCNSHQTCVAESLTGLCCPTNEGVFLRCCS